MQRFMGKGIVEGAAAGSVFFREKEAQAVAHAAAADPAEELERYRSAKDAALAELGRLCEKARTEAGEENAAIFEAQKLILEDGGYNASVSSIITEEKLCAEYAVKASGEKYAAKLAATGDELLKERAADVKDISERVIRILCGGEGGIKAGDKRILAAEEPAPSDLFLFERGCLLALVTKELSAESHVAILARTMGIPVVSGIAPERGWNGRQALADGSSGSFILDPDEEMLKELRRRKAGEEERRKALRELKGKASQSRSGKKVRICANIGNVPDLDSLIENDAEGVGLFRSEFLCMEQGGLPSEEEQFEAYRTVAEGMDGRPVVIRSFDLGADKQAGSGETEKEENPALGLRGIRRSLAQPEAFRTQLRAVLRAALYGEVLLMFPMIISEEEFLQCKKHVAEAKEELKQKGVPYREELKLGVMIETPAAALISAQLAEEADFFSIGSNDLTQYTLALDRQDTRLAGLWDAHHPAVLELIRLTVENAHKAGIPVGICGELAGDTTLTQAFLDQGVDVLSVPPYRILPLREAVRNCE